jgi:hypothetical protein
MAPSARDEIKMFRAMSAAILLAVDPEILRGLAETENASANFPCGLLRCIVWHVQPHLTRDRFHHQLVECRKPLPLSRRPDRLEEMHLWQLNAGAQEQEPNRRERRWLSEGPPSRPLRRLLPHPCPNPSHAAVVRGLSACCRRAPQKAMERGGHQGGATIAGSELSRRL